MWTTGSLKKTMGNKSRRPEWDRRIEGCVCLCVYVSVCVCVCVREREREREIYFLTYESWGKKGGPAAKSNETNPNPSLQPISTAGWEERTNLRHSQIPQVSSSKDILMLGMCNHKNPLSFLHSDMCTMNKTGWELNSWWRESYANVLTRKRGWLCSQP